MESSVDIVLVQVNCYHSAEHLIVTQTRDVVRSRVFPANERRGCSLLSGFHSASCLHEVVTMTSSIIVVLGSLETHIMALRS